MTFGAILLTALLSTSTAATVHLLPQEADRLRIAYLADSDGSGTPPCAYKVLVGIPLKGEVSLTVVHAELARSSATPGLAVKPCGSSSHEEPAFLGTTAFLREQRVAEVWFSGTDQGDMGEYERIVVDLHLPTSAKANPVLSLNPGTTSFEEELYARAVLNYEQARGWRRSLLDSARPKATAPEADGVRLRLSVRQTGIYEVSGKDLRAAGLNLGDISTNKIALLYGGGRALPREMSATSDHILQAVEILVEDGGDGRFDSEDSFLFYGESLSRWVRNPDTGGFQYIKHPYSRDNVYWLSLNREVGSRGTVQASISDMPAFTRDSYRVRLHEETENATTDVAEGNIQSGLEWYWKDFRSGDSETFSFVIRKPAEGPTTIRLRFVSRSESNRFFSVIWNNQRVGTARFATAEPHLFDFTTDDAPLNGLNDLTLDNISGDLSLFDWYELEFDRQLEAAWGQLLFDSRDSSGVVEYRLSGFTDTPRLFEVSDGFREIVNFAHDRAADMVVFRDKAEPGQSYLAVTPSRVRKPERIELTEQNRLNLQSTAGADYLIISHGDFLEHAERLAAWRESDDRFGPPVSTTVVDVQDIYNSFSVGLFDPTAIRDFVRHTTLNWDPVPTFVLLLGDGSYDYKNNSGTSTGNWIPPYEDKDLTTDDWYVSVIGEDQLADMAVGRLPVQAVSEARTVVDKLIDYDSNPEIGDWQSRVLLVADDTFNADDRTLVETMFVNDSEKFASEFLPTDLDIEKLYLLEFPLEGRFKPRARDAFVERFNAGSLLLVYIGHGNAQVFAHEHIFVLSTDVDKIANSRRLPFLYTAASQMAVFDDPLRDSIPEALLKRHKGGIIGMIGATRVGFHRSNMDVARYFHRFMFRDARQHVPVGIALMAAKASSDAEIRKILRYNLLGDPLTRLSRPTFTVQIESSVDTLRALGEVRVTGHLTDNTGKLLENFSGQVRLQAFDSTTLRSETDRAETIEYQKHGAPIFRGVLPVAEGQFETLFRVPKDITYGGGEGRMAAYAWNDRVSAFGSTGPFVLLGTDGSAPPDNEGPEIEFTLDGRQLGNEQQVVEVTSRGLLQATLRDPSGINITGEIGHRIELGIDGESTDVTKRYESTNDYRTGVLQIQLPVLEPGRYTLQLEAWDTYNNWAEKQIEFRFSDSVEGLSDVLFHPNPLRHDGGFFTFALSQTFESVQIRVYSATGRLVAELRGAGQQGYNQMAWRPDQELANGTYLYKISANRLDGSSSDKNSVIQLIR